MYKSGIGDLDDARVVVPAPQSGPVDFSYAVSLKGERTSATNVFPPIDFSYRIWAEGTMTRPAGPYPFGYQVKAYPRKTATFNLSASGDWPAAFSYVVSGELLTGGVADWQIKVNYTDSQGTGGGKADIVWIVDGSGSMGSYQQSIANNATAFTNNLISRGIDFRLGVVAFCDISEPKPSASGDGWTADPTEFGNMVTSVGTDYGDGGTENGLAALNNTISYYTFRPDARIYFIIVTDEAAADFSEALFTSTSDNLINNSVILYGIINPANSRPYDWHNTSGDGDGLIQRTGGLVQDITASDWSATLSNISGDISTHLSGNTRLYTSTLATNQWTRANNSTVRQLVELDLGTGNLPADLYTNTTRYTVESYEVVSADPQAQFKFSTDGVDTVTGLAAETAYVYGQTSAASQPAGSVSAGSIYVESLSLAADSEATKVAVSTQTAAEILAPYVPAGHVVSAYSVVADSGVQASTLPDGTGQVMAWAGSDVTHFTGSWDLAGTVTADQGVKVVAQASAYRPANSFGRPYPGTDASYVLTDTSTEQQVEVFWLDTGVTGSGSGAIAVSTTEEYTSSFTPQSPGSGSIMAGEEQSFSMPNFVDANGTAMPSYPSVLFVLTQTVDSPAYFFFGSKPGNTTATADRITTENRYDTITVKADESYVVEQQRSGYFNGFGRVNGREPMMEDGDGEAPLTVQLPDLGIAGDSVKYYVSVSDSRVRFVFSSGGREYTTNPQDSVMFYSNYRSTITRSLAWSSAEHVYVGRTADSYLSPTITLDPAADPSYTNDVTGLEPVVYSLTPGVEVWIDSYAETGVITLRVGARIRAAMNTGWHPLVHAGYYYFGDREYYLYAENLHQGKTFIPDTNNELEVSPVPQQGAPIIVRDAFGHELTRVAFRDDSGNLTLFNTERLSGSGDTFYLLYDRIDPSSLTVKVNGSTVSASLTGNKLTLSAPVVEADVVEVTYGLFDSYYVDYGGSSARLKFYPPSVAGQYDFVTVEYETSRADPYYGADEVELNPIFTHLPSGFLYITQSGQTPKSLLLNVSPASLPQGRREPVLATARLLDVLDNPIPEEDVVFSLDGVQAATVRTDTTGEAHFSFQSPAVTTVAASALGLYAEEQLERYQAALPDRYYLHLSGPSAVKDSALLSVELYDARWRPVSASVRISYVNDAGVTVNTSVSTDAFGRGSYVYRASGARRVVRVTASYAGSQSMIALYQEGT